MKDQEVNRIIAEFMGLEIIESQYTIEGVPITSIFDRYMGMTTQKLYTQSLDALVPVWEKLEFFYLPNIEKHREWGKSGEKLAIWRSCHNFRGKLVYGCGDTIQQAAAHATAKAILELGGGE